MYQEKRKIICVKVFPTELNLLLEFSSVKGNSIGFNLTRVNNDCINVNIFFGSFLFDVLVKIHNPELHKN